LKEEQLLEHLVELARSLDFDVRMERGSFRDGGCRIEDRKIIVLNRASPAIRKVIALAEVLSDQPLGDIFLLPAVRETIESVRKTTDQP
jgi:hypothetical protein